MRWSKEVKVGIFSIIGISLLLIGLSYLQGRSILEKTKTYHVIYQDINGLIENNKVLLSGYQIGKVKAIAMDENTGKIHVDFEMSKGIRVPVDSKAMIVTLDLLGNRGIQLVLGQSSQMAEKGATLKDSVQKGMVDNVVDQLMPVKDRVENILEEIQVITRAARETIQDSVNRVNKIAKNIELTTQNVATFSGKLVPLSRQFSAVADSISLLVSDIKQNTPQLNKIMNNAEALTASLKTTADGIPPLMNSTRNSVERIQGLLSRVERGEGTAGKIINDPALYNNLAAASKSLDSLLVDLRARPKRYVHFSLFGRKEKK